jgi:hypothetical protein
MRNMSFALTTDAVAAKRKTVTRRFGWWFLKPGDLIQPIEKCMGIPKGSSQVKIGCPIRVVSVRTERLLDIKQDDVIREGFSGWTTDEFIEMLVAHYRCKPWAIINRIEFEYLEPKERI